MNLLEINMRRELLLLYLKSSPGEKLTGVLVIFSLFALGFIIYFALKSRKEKSQAKGMELIARQLGWSFTPLLTAQSFARYCPNPFHLTDESNDKDTSIGFHNVMRTQINNTEATVFDYHYYHYARGYGNIGSSYEETMIHFRSPRLNLPSFSIVPIGTVGRTLRNATGMEKREVNFPSNPQFSAHYVLHGKDERMIQNEEEQAIRRVFNSAVLSFYEQTMGTVTRGFNNEFLYYRPGKTVPPEAIRAFLDEAFRLLALLENASQYVARF
jgi:hypothetical protein